MSLDQSEHGEPGPLQRLLRRLIVVRPEEVRVVLWCWLYIFSVLSSYYIMRPIRDQMGIAGGVNNLQWLFTGTLIGMLALNLPFAWLVTKLPRSRFIPITYHFFALNILLFAVALLIADQEQAVWVGRIFFIWASIYNLFVVSVFWQLNVDLFSPAQGKRLFGFIAAGATVGAIVGSGLTAGLARYVSQTFLLIGAAILLEIAVFSVGRLARLSPRLHRHRQARQNSGDTSRRSGAVCGPALSTRYAHPTCWGSVPLCCCSQSPRPSFISSRPQSSAVLLRIGEHKPRSLPRSISP